jgi:three-Cys-motif partner protein
MAKDFHKKPFDDETILKLEIFQGYIREWLPVFLSKKKFDSIYIFDFFAGPGKDCNGVEGSPLIIIDEIKKYLSDPQSPYTGNVSIQLFFNDDDSDKTLSLQDEVAQKDVSFVKISNQKFKQAFDASRVHLKASSAAKLIILDQGGIKQITPDIFKELINFPATDFMFFITSSSLRRFISTDEFGRYFPDMLPEKIKNIPATDVHRFVCNYYQKLVPSEKSFYVAPFSIKKGANIYGIIFGSGILLGLEKFLKVCWNKDNISGGANYDIDDDMVREGKTLFTELNVSKKKDFFKKRLVIFLQDFRSNNELYKFTLENGCLLTHTVEILKGLQKSGSLEAEPSDTRKNSFYLSWENYRKKIVKAKFRIKK